MRATRAWKYIFILLALTRVNSRRLEAQSGTSSAISGTVTDASGDVIPNASVTATETNTKAIRTGKTDVSGRYLFSQMNPGTYQVVVRASRFRCSNFQAYTGRGRPERGIEFFDPSSVNPNRGSKSRHSRGF